MVEKKKRERIKNRDTSRDYVNGPELQRSLEAWYESGSEKIPDKICNAIFGTSGIIERLGRKGSFSGYSYLDMMKSDATLACLKALQGKKYKLNQGNPFAYFSMISHNAFVHRINLEHKENYVKHKNGVWVQHELEMGGEMWTGVVQVDEASDAVIETFESKMESKKKTKKKKKSEMDQFYED